MRFLIVDDSPTSRKLTMSALRTLGYNDSVDAEDGVQALRVLKSEKIDIMITDWNMPNLNGLELTNVIRSDKELMNLPILLCTTRGDKNDIMKAIKSRVNGYIVKPFTPKTLQEKIAPIIKIYKDRLESEETKKELPIKIEMDSINIEDINDVNISLKVKGNLKSEINSILKLNLSKHKTKIKRIVNTLIIENSGIVLKSEAFDFENNTVDTQEIAIDS